MTFFIAGDLNSGNNQVTVEMIGEYRRQDDFENDYPVSQKTVVQIQDSWTGALSAIHNGTIIGGTVHRTTGVYTAQSAPSIGLIRQREIQGLLRQQESDFKGIWQDGLFCERWNEGNCRAGAIISNLENDELYADLKAESSIDMRTWYVLAINNTWLSYYPGTWDVSSTPYWYKTTGTSTLQNSRAGTPVINMQLNREANFNHVQWLVENF